MASSALEEAMFDMCLEDAAPTVAEQATEGAIDRSDAASDGDADDMTCAICLEQTPFADLALIKGCEHQYCVYCILQWALCKEWCPQCKAPFDHLLTHRQLDGTLCDYPIEESVCLLKRARWFEDHVKARESAIGPTRRTAPADHHDNDAAIAAAAAGVGDRDWFDAYEAYVDEELEEDEQIEEYYFSSAAGRARVVLGNRRGGEGGFMRSGRQYARPRAPPPQQQQQQAGGGVRGKGKAGGRGPKHQAGLPPGGPCCDNGTGSISGAAAFGRSPPGTAFGRSPPGGGYGHSPPSCSTPPAAAAMGSSPGASGSGSGGREQGSGRRAKRAARRASAWDD